MRPIPAYLWRAGHRKCGLCFATLQRANYAAKREQYAQKRRARDRRWYARHRLVKTARVRARSRLPAVREHLYYWRRSRRTAQRLRELSF